MKADSASKTALGTAIGRALEWYRSDKDRLFEDPFARAFLTPGYRLMLDLLRLPGIGPALLAMRERQIPGIMGNLFCRTRFIDDALRNALEKGLDQVVILGAGLDSRAYRMPAVDQTRSFEVDHPPTSALKQTRVKRVLGTIPAHISFVPIDFDRQNLDTEMAAADFRTGAQTLFIWEGVTQYITAEAVDATFRYVSRAAAAGSGIVFTYIKRGIIDGSIDFKGKQSLFSYLKRYGVPWVFGIDPAELSRYLAERGFALIEQVGAPEYQKRYLDHLDRQMNIFESELTVVARIEGT
jgi:methyltransferase (TIGR00027 family)